ncbi:MAG: YqeG family HAD IIIA-type phosphatase [Streptococcus sp.]|nr:YqeG family HAD IIIA-type phosphatase [Streptococcus sp.]
MTNFYLICYNQKIWRLKEIIRMIRQFLPRQHVKSVFSIDYKNIYQKGFRAILFDIDATLVPHGCDVTPEVESLLQYVQSIGFKVLLISNNSDERIRMFTRNVAVPYIPLANKPHPEAYLKALTVLGVEKDKTLVIGDQIFTDVLGANRAGLDSVIVNFLPQKNETKLGKKRRVEKILLQLYRLFGLYDQQTFGEIEKREV